MLEFIKILSAFISGVLVGAAALCVCENTDDADIKAGQKINDIEDKEKCKVIITENSIKYDWSEK